MTGRATPDLLAGLWADVRDALIERLAGQKRPSGELLQVARRFLRDAGYQPPHDDRTRETLERLRKLYLQRLVEGLEQPHASPALLTEARQYFSANPPAGPAEAHDQPALGVPFTKQ